MKKRMICLILAISLFLGLFPPGSAHVARAEEAPAETYPPGIMIYWDGGKELYYSYDPAVDEQYLDAPDGVPEGVTLEGSTLTLENAEIERIHAFDWVDIPLHIVVRGDNRIVNSVPDWSSLSLIGCYDVTMDGGGSVFMESPHVTLHTYTAQPGTDLYYKDSHFLIQDVDLHIVNTYDDAVFNDDTAWGCSAVSLQGNTTIDGCNLYIRGHCGFQATGSTIVTGGTVIDADGVSLSAIAVCHNDESQGYYRATTVIEDATLNITPHKNGSGWGSTTFGVHPGVDLHIREGVEILVDSSECPYPAIPLMVHDDYLRTAGAATLTMEGGKLHVITTPQPGSSGINIGPGAAWTQLDGHVILDAIHYDSNFTNWGRDSVISIYGGTTDINGTGISITSESAWNQFGGDVTVSAATDEGCGFYLDRNATALFADGTLTLTNNYPALREMENHDTVYANGFQTVPGADLTITGGAITTAGDWVHGMELSGVSTITGGQLDLAGIRHGATFHANSSTVLAGGHISAVGRYHSIVLSTGSAMTMTDGFVELEEHGLYICHNAFARLLGGELAATGDYALYVESPQNGGLTLADGICAAYEDGSAARIIEGENYLTIPSEGRTVTVKSQTVRGAKPNLMLTMSDPDRIVPGVRTGVRLLVSGVASGEIVTVTLPVGSTLVEGSLLHNGRKMDYTLTEGGFTLNADKTGAYTFTVIPAHTGELPLTAICGEVEASVQVICQPYELIMPELVDQPKVHVSGSANKDATMILYLDGEEAARATAKSTGHWNAVIELPSEGYHYIYGILMAPDGACLAITPSTRVLYDPNGIVAKSLQVENYIHGSSMLSAPVKHTLLIDYETGIPTPDYYIYWPDMPNFTFIARFKDDRGTPDTIYDVYVIASDSSGNAEIIPLQYNKFAGVWVGGHNFCDYENITPVRFRLQYRCKDPYPEPEPPVWEPDHLPEPTRTDSSDGAAIVAPAQDGAYTLALSKDAVVASLSDGIGRTVPYTITDGKLTFPAEAGECYVVTLSDGSFPDYPGKDTVSIFISGGGPRADFTYADRVRAVSSADLKDRTADTFRSDLTFSPGDVLLIDGIEAITITSASSTLYSFEAAALDELYATLDVSGIDTTRPLTVEWGTPKEELLRQFRESALFAKYRSAMEVVLQDWSNKSEYKFELGDVEASIELGYGTKNDGMIFVKPIFTITTEMTTELPHEGELKTKVKAELSYEVLEDLNYRIRSINDDADVQSYSLFTNETVTAELHLGVEVEGDPNTPEEYFSDFKELLEQVKKNFLEALENGKEEDFDPLKDVKVHIPTPIPAISVVLSPGMEVEWSFFGEMKTDAVISQTTTKGILVTHLGADYGADWTDWSIRTFSEDRAPEASLETTLHLSAALGLMYRMEIAVSVAQCLELGLYAEAGPKITVGGHGSFAIRSDGSGSSSAELLAALILEFEGGVFAGVSLKKLPFKLPKWQKELITAAVPLAEIGERIMPWQFTIVEEGEVTVPSTGDLKKQIDIRLDCQNFNVDGSIFEDSKELAENRYTFELQWTEGAVTVSPNGQFIVRDTEREFDFCVKVTYHGSSEGYKIWKIVELHYSPATITIHKTAEEVPPIASFVVRNLTNPYDRVRCVTTNSAGVVTFEVATGCTYEIIEIAPPPKNVPVDPYEILFVGGHASASFANIIPPEPEPIEPPSPPVTPIGDPSGYVYEGIETNRLSGVTATLYQADDEQGTNARLWNAEAFGQRNPLLTDAMGQYQWMVPDGWWQVRYTLEGYDSAASEWMVVPPIRTEVNQNLVSDAPADMLLRYSQEEKCLALIFSRPVIASSLSDLVLTLNGEPLGGSLEPANPGWSVTEDPADSRVCATDFYLHPHTDRDLTGQTITVTLKGAETYRFTDCGSLTAELTVPAQKLYRLTTEGADGTGYYEAGTTITVTASDHGCFPFRYWDAEGLNVDAASGSTLTFIMPECDVRLAARFSEEPVHSYITEVTEPGCESHGYTEHRCTVCGEGWTDAYTDPLDHEWQGLSCRRCGAFREDPFQDVPGDSFYYEPVMWAVRGGITNGTSDTTFGPGDQCMRAHVVTFLWRAAGSPEPRSQNNPFTDVGPKDFYYKAVLWAVENGITSGMDATHFGPLTYCNRAQVVTFLYRAMGKPPVMEAEKTFTDVEAGSFYELPVLWAVENGITSGLDANHFGPGSICNRAQIVTFLYRTFCVS